MAQCARDDLPGTPQRSDRKAQDTDVRTRASAEAYYHDGGRAARTASSAVKPSHEKVADNWEPNKQRGPSDAHVPLLRKHQQAARGGDPARNPAPTEGGVDAAASKAHLLVLAQEGNVRGRSRMTQHQLVSALRCADDAATAKARR
jgi:hypothetical protein